MLTIETYRGLGSLPPGYAEVFEDSARESIFLGRMWLESFERIILGDGRSLIYGVESASRPVAALLLQEQDDARPALAPRALASLSNYYTPRYGVAKVAGADTAELLDVLIAALWEERSRWDVLDLRPLPLSSGELDAFSRACAARGIPTQSFFCFGNWYLELEGASYRDYLQRLSPTLRKNVSYYLRRLQSTAGGRIDILTDGDGVERALADYETVYASSWKVPEPHPDFIRSLVRNAAAAGALRLGVAYVEGQPAAAQIWLVNDGVASIFKIAYDERFSKLSVGTSLTARLMEHVIDTDKVAVVDYLSGDDAYKQKWMSARREFWGIRAFNPRSLRGAAQMARHIGGRWIKSALRRRAPQEAANGTGAEPDGR